jgi:hypothetical protein
MGNNKLIKIFLLYFGVCTFSEQISIGLFSCYIEMFSSTFVLDFMVQDGATTLIIMTLSILTLSSILY